MFEQIIVVIYLPLRGVANFQILQLMRILPTVALLLFLCSQVGLQSRTNKREEYRCSTRVFQNRVDISEIMSEQGTVSVLVIETPEGKPFTGRLAPKPRTVGDWLYSEPVSILPAVVVQLDRKEFLVQLASRAQVIDWPKKIAEATEWQQHPAFVEMRRPTDKELQYFQHRKAQQADDFWSPGQDISRREDSQEREREREPEDKEGGETSDSFDSIEEEKADAKRQEAEEAVEEQGPEVQPLIPSAPEEEEEEPEEQSLVQQIAVNPQEQQQWEYFEMEENPQQTEAVAPTELAAAAPGQPDGDDSSSSDDEDKPDDKPEPAPAERREEIDGKIESKREPRKSRSAIVSACPKDVRSKDMPQKK